MIAYTITTANNVWMIDEAEGGTIPQWCHTKDGYFVVDKLPDDVQALVNSKAFNTSRDTKSQEIQAAYNTANQLDIAYMSTTFQANKDSQNLIVSVLSAGSVPDGFFWLDVSNNQVAMTYAELQGLSGAILARSQINFVKYQNLKAQVNAAMAVEELDAIIW